MKFYINQITIIGDYLLCKQTNVLLQQRIFSVLLKTQIYNSIIYWCSYFKYKI